MNNITYTLRFPTVVTTRNFDWLDKIPGIEIDTDLTIRAYNESASVGTVPAPIGGVVTYNSSSDTGILFTSSDTTTPGFGTLVTYDQTRPGILYDGYSGQFPLEGFLYRDLKYRMVGPRLDASLQPDVEPGIVYGRNWTWTFPTAKQFTTLDINVPDSTSPLSIAQVPGWVYVFGSNDNGTTWSLAGDPQTGTRFTLYQNKTWKTFRVLIASAGTYSFLVGSFIFKGPTVATINTTSQNVTDFMCLESQLTIVNGTRPSDLPVSQSPVWSYTTERNITYKSETGNLIIDNSVFRIGGQTINEIPGEYICLYQDLSVPDENQIGLTALTGKNDTQLVTSQKTYLAKIPFFDLLPVCSLKHHDIDINIQISTFGDVVGYKGLGVLDPSSRSTIYSNNIDISTDSSPTYISPKTYFVNNGNLVSYDLTTFSIGAHNISGNLFSICSNIYAYDGNLLMNTQNPGSAVTVPGAKVGNDGLETIYIFGQGSNIFTSFAYDTLSFSNSFVKNQRLILPPGYVNAQVSYIDVLQAVVRTVNVPFTIRSQVTYSSESIAQIYNDTEYYANATVPFVTNLVWNADYNANCYYSIDHTYQYQLGTRVTSNTSTKTSTEPDFRWSVSSLSSIFPGIYSSAVNYQESIGYGTANLYYTGNFIESFKYISITDPYGVQPSDPNLRATFRYCRGTNGSWKTIQTSNLNNVTVYRGIQSKRERCANVLVGYQGVTYISPVPGSNIVVTYYRWDSNTTTSNITSSGQYIDPPSTYETPNGQIINLGGTTTCTIIGTDLIFCGPLPIYSVRVDDGNNLSHRPIQGLALPRTYSTGQTLIIDGNISYTVKSNVSEWVTDRLYVSNGIFYGLGTINGLSETYGTTNNIKTLMDQGLVVLSDSTPWQNRLNTDRVYYTGTTWSLPSNIWPQNLSITFFNETNNATTVSAPRETFNQTLINSGFGSLLGTTWTLKNAVYATCYDIRTMSILGLVDNIIPITYYQNPRVWLSVGGLPDYPFNSPIDTVIGATTTTCTDYNGRVYTASYDGYPYLMQVTGNSLSVYDYTGDLTPNRIILPNKELFFTTVTDGRYVYWITKTGTILRYDSFMEFGTDGSIELFAILSLNNIFSAVLTKQYIAMSTTSDSNLYFLDLMSKELKNIVIDRTSGILSWDDARYLTVFNSNGPSNSILQIDTITYTEPSEIQMNMLIEYALVSETERSLFVSSDNDHLFKQIQVEEFVIRAGIEEDQFEMKFRNLVSEFFFTLDGEPQDDFISIGITLNGYPLLDYDDTGTELALSKIQPYEHHTRIPDRAFWMYSFATKPERMNPSGFINMSRIRDQVISVKVNPSAIDRKFRIWATTYNVIKFRDGLCGLLY